MYFDDIAFRFEIENPNSKYYENEVYWKPKIEFYNSDTGPTFWVKWFIFSFMIDVTATTPESRERLMKSIKEAMGEIKEKDE